MFLKAEACLKDHFTVYNDLVALDTELENIYIAFFNYDRGSMKCIALIKTVQRSQ